MKPLEPAYQAMAVLLSAAGDSLTPIDRQLLLVQAKEVRGIGQPEKDRLATIYQAAWRGFFRCAATGHAFVPSSQIQELFGCSLEANYPSASQTFMRFATSYWTLKTIAIRLTGDTACRGTALEQAFLKMEIDLASVFFPTPGPARVPRAEREQAQRATLEEYGAGIDIEEFIRDNPILLAPQRSSSFASSLVSTRVATGLLIMAPLAVLVGWQASKWLGALEGAIICVIVFGAWCCFNFRSGTQGLFKANLRSYFAHRRRGQSVDQAIESMVRSRYVFSRRKQQEALALVSRIPTEATEDVKVVQAVFAVFCFEQGPPPTNDLRRRFWQQIASLYGEWHGTTG